MKDLVFGLIGGLVGAIAWALVAVATETEFALLAWAIGGLVGVAVSLGNGDGARSPIATGGLAVAITVLSVAGGKYAAVEMIAPSEDQIAAMMTTQFEDEEFVVSFLADDVAAEFESLGRQLTWPAGVDRAYASSRADYPRDVWLEAEQRWADFAPTDRTSFRESRIRLMVDGNVPATRRAMIWDAYFAIFSPMDLIFFGLALLTAFRVASGVGSEDDLVLDDPEAGDPSLAVDPAWEPIAASEIIREPGALSYCPRCASQYRPGFDSCAQCGEVLSYF